MRKKNILFFAPAYAFMLFMLFFNGSCNEVGDPALCTEGSVNQISIDNDLSGTFTSGNEITINLTLSWCSNFNGGLVKIWIYDGSTVPNEPYASAPLGNPSAGFPWAVKYTPDKGKYTIFARLYDKDGNYGEFCEKFFTVGNGAVPTKEFKIAEISMVNDGVFRKTANYDAKQKLFKPFNEAYVSIVATDQCDDNLNKPASDFTDYASIKRWVSTFIKPDINISVICGIDDVSIADYPTAVGLTWHRIPNGQDAWPSLSIVINSRINALDQYNDLDYRAKMATEVAVHELGHALGINNDGPLINPDHDFTATWLDHTTCAMCQGLYNGVIDLLSFCDGPTGHRAFIHGTATYKNSTVKSWLYP